MVKLQRRHWLLGAVSAWAAAPAWAQAYPAKPLRLVVPQAAGGGSDTIARYVAERLASALGQQIVVDAKAPNDAYREAANASDESVRTAKLAEHAAKVRGHIDALGGKD